MDSALAAEVVRLGQALRRLDQHDLEEVASTRLLIFTARLIAAGMPPREACLACLAQALSDDPHTRRGADGRGGRALCLNHGACRATWRCGFSSSPS